MQPVRRPRMTLVDFMMGEPNFSHRMMVRKTRKPRPMYSALPQRRAWGAAMLGHNWKKPSSGWPAQRPDPPAQFWKPVPIKWTPMSMTV
jgi:hypothetical protein